MKHPIRLAVRGIILNENRLLLVNAYPSRGDLWCAPGGGAELHQSLPDNLAREIFEETGLTVSVGAPCLTNEFHAPNGTFHQVEIFFRCILESGQIDDTWQDPENVVSMRRWVTRQECEALQIRPKSLAAVAWGDPEAPSYDPLEPIIP